MYAREGLFVVELVFWIPLLLVSAFVAFKHGLSKQMDWFSLLLLSVFRIVGATTGIVVIYHPSEGVIEASFICASVGLISLIGALSGIMLRVNMNMQANRIITPQRAKIVHMPSVAALILAIIAGTEVSNGRPSDTAQAILFFKISVGLITSVYLVIIATTLYTARHKSDVLRCERLFVKVSLIAIPIMIVCLVYAWLGAFMSAGSIFDMQNESGTAISVRTFMQVLEEVVVAVLFLYAGMKVDNTTAPTHKDLVAARQGGFVHSAVEAAVCRAQHRQDNF